jgi:hypothetical protein
LPVKPEVHLNQPAIQQPQQIFSMSLHIYDSPRLCHFYEMLRGLPARGNRKENVHAPDALPSHQRPQRLRNSFNFRKFRRVLRLDFLRGRNLSVTESQSRPQQPLAILTDA